MQLHPKDVNLSWYNEFHKIGDVGVSSCFPHPPVFELHLKFINLFSSLIK